VVAVIALGEAAFGVRSTVISVNILHIVVLGNLVDLVPRAAEILASPSVVSPATARGSTA